MAPPVQPKHMLDRAKLVPNPTSLIAYLETSNVQREPLTPSLASHKSRALLAFENRHADPQQVMRLLLLRLRHGYRNHYGTIRRAI